MTNIRPLFPLGQIVATPCALELLNEDQVAHLLSRHIQGDDGDLDDEDKLTNQQARMYGNRILSSYELSDAGPTIWIITEADRSSTCILLPSEY